MNTAFLKNTLQFKLQKKQHEKGIVENILGFPFFLIICCALGLAVMDIFKIEVFGINAITIDNFISQQWELAKHSVKEFLTVLSFVDRHVYIKLFLVWFYINIFAFIVCGFISALAKESLLLKYGIVNGFIKSVLWTFYNTPSFTTRELTAMYSVTISDPGIDILIEEKPFKTIAIWDVYTDLVTGCVSSFTTLFIYITSALSLFIPTMRPFAKGWKNAYMFLGEMISRRFGIENKK